MKRIVGFAAVLVCLIGSKPGPARAIPVFAHRYGFSCQVCHTVVPHLTDFGEKFLAAGYRLPGVPVKGTFPIAVRNELSYSSEANENPRLPKAIVDEIEFLTGGSFGKRYSYWFEQYALDGGVPGHTRDAWLAWWVTDPSAKIPINLRGGQFTVPLPLDPETFRETTDHYAIWDQVAGENPFNFFNPKAGVQISVGNSAIGTSAIVSLLQGHDTQSGIPSHGLDRMLYAQHSVGPWTLSGYRYDGARIIDRLRDGFWRQGYGLEYRDQRAQIDAVYQTGHDSSASSSVGPLVTSGGFVQLRWAFNARLFGIARWDATQDSAFARAWIAGLGYRVTRNSRLSAFDTYKFSPAASRYVHVLSSSLLIAF